MISPKRYWNTKHPKEPIIYGGRSLKTKNDRIDIDVRRMIWHEDVVIKKVVEKESLKKESFDETAWTCQKYVVKNMKYTDDKKTANMDEFWQFPNESLVTFQGDCEDGAILMASLMLNAGIPDWRVRVSAGMVSVGKGAATGGHAYVTYCRESDNNWVVLDWCYYEDSSTSVDKKPIFKDKKRYKEIWFSWNHVYSWSHKTIDVVEKLEDLIDDGKE